MPPPVAAVAKKLGANPYVFGTLGALQDGVKVENGVNTISDKNTSLAGQIGIGMQFNHRLGGEVFYQGAQKHKYLADITTNEANKVRNQTYGARVTFGDNVTDKFRLFGKAGVAGVKHSVGDSNIVDVHSKTKVRPTAGVGATYNLTDNLAVRADYDHVFKRGTQSFTNNQGQNGNVKWKGANYLGVGLQYNF
ncbi:outer membrane protein [Wielerella bovis]|uniref:outer membrane protein n=1 Tax=Wielerella bovis TaxID=2917790 RepID=UPI002019671F|nr:outer membrane beta-barrel protein [Wielerella bovis]MCG7656577.1 TonB-dependent receptor [Wielerella bovis]